MGVLAKAEQQLGAGHQRDEKPGPQRGAQQGPELGARVGDVLLAHAPGAAGDALRQQLDVLRKQIANAVAAVLGNHQFKEQRHRQRVALGRRGFEQLHQLAEARDALFQPHQLVGQADAGAGPARLLANLADDLGALFQQHVDLAAVELRVAFVGGGLAPLVNEVPHLGVLGQKRRLVALDGRVVAHQLGLEADGGDAITQHLDGRDDLQGQLALVVAGAVVDVDGAHQVQPRLGARSFHPLVIVAAVEQQAQHVFQIVGVDHVGQHAVPDAPRQRRREPFARQHARVGEQVHAVLFGQQGQQGIAQRAPRGGFGAQHQRQLSKAQAWQFGLAAGWAYQPHQLAQLAQPLFAIAIGVGQHHHGGQQRGAQLDQSGVGVGFGKQRHQGDRNRRKASAGRHCEPKPRRKCLKTWGARWIRTTCPQSLQCFSPSLNTACRGRAVK